MEIINPFNAIHREKPDGTRVDYYLQPEYEIHYNEVPPGTTQEWHSHNKQEEVLFIIEGALEARWLEKGEKRSESVHKGDLIRVENTIHTFANISDKNAAFIVFKMILSGKDNSNTFKEDKILADPKNG